MDTLRDDMTDNTRANTVPAEATTGHHESDGTMGEVAGTGAGALSGGIVGAAIGGPIGAVIGAVAGGVLGSAAGDVAHKIGDDHDDVNLSTGRDGAGERTIGSGAGAVSGAVLGSAAGPVGTVAGAVAGGMLGAAAGDAAKHVGEGGSAMPSGVVHAGVDMPGNNIPGVQTGGHAVDGTMDTRGISEKAADTLTGNQYDDKTGKPIV